ncbi:carnitine 3-dehydrogenase [Limibaculum sp. M0105]|uniref:L-carnitine dehydrogenase n=1 Tax=Thermohalobaculum xanthum TaxID=2753746 RepID=A0A8J7SG12_9RHOB|nr:carnitine 3-dehydrogenase [Thermohalobaculum xanthum]MBK0400738.1 carnitine 3-dehydrogenase [Thermohalobaculum xanthum]
MSSLKRAAILGGGVIGGGWLARLIENGVEVTVYDPDPEARRKLGEVLANAERAYGKLTLAPRPAKGGWRLAGSVAEAVEGAELIVEAVPERIDLKHKVYAEIETANAEGIIASSTSGYKPSDLQKPLAHPERLIVAHPFNPVYLLPLVEIVAGERTDAGVVERAKEIYATIGMKPLHIRKEIDAFIADRFLEAVWREALWLVKDGIGTTEEIDDAIRFGFGLRWAQMGLFETYRVAGGEAGMRHFIAQFGPCLKWPWTKLMDVPELTDELIDMVADQSHAQSGKYSIRELERIRDDNLVAIMQALKANDWGAGKVLADYEKRLFALTGTKAQDFSRPFVTAEARIPADWTDYNGHMNESRYGQLFSDAADGAMKAIGADQDYIARGLSYFTVEIHIRYLDEAKAGDRVTVTTQVLEGKGKKLRLFHWMRHEDGRLLATGEQMLIHVSLETRAACDPAPAVAAKLGEIAAAHAALPLPEGVGRAVGQRP